MVAGKIRVTFFANTDDYVFKSKSFEFTNSCFCFFKDHVVETTAETTVSGDHHKRHLLHRSDTGKWDINVFYLELFVDAVKNFN